MSIVKNGFKEAKNRLVIVSLPLSFFAILTMLVLVLGFYAPLTLILTVPFIVIPSFFSLSAINTVAPNRNTHEGFGFFIMFRAYFSQIFRGGYKVIIGLLKSLATFILTCIILSAILSPTILYKDPGYLAFIDQINAMTDVEQINEALVNFMNTNKAFNNILLITNAVGSFAAFYMFMHHFSINSFKYNYNFLAKLPLPMQDLILIDRTVRKSNKKQFYNDYYKAFWFLALLLIIGYAGGVLISYFFINNIDMVQMNIIGLFGSFILLLMFVPYYLNASQLIFEKYKGQYIDTLIDLSKKSLEEMKKMQAISEEKEKEVMQMIESQKEESNDKTDNSSKQ